MDTNAIDNLIKQTDVVMDRILLNLGIKKTLLKIMGA